MLTGVLGSVERFPRTDCKPRNTARAVALETVADPLGSVPWTTTRWPTARLLGAYEKLAKSAPGALIPKVVDAKATLTVNREKTGTRLLTSGFSCCTSIVNCVA